MFSIWRKSMQCTKSRRIKLNCSKYVHCSDWGKNNGNSDGKDDIPGNSSKQYDDPSEPCIPRSGEPPGLNIYDQRKYGHNSPTNNVNMYFPPLPNLPTGIFRKIDGEVLGLGAGKCCTYKNPEYFSFHHMSFYDMHLLMRCYRLPSAKTGRKP